MRVQLFNRLDRLWRSGFARCTHCEHEHVSVAPANVMLMECPACGDMASHWVDEEEIVRGQNDEEE